MDMTNLEQSISWAFIAPWSQVIHVSITMIIDQLNLYFPLADFHVKHGNCTAY